MRYSGVWCMVALLAMWISTAACGGSVRAMTIAQQAVEADRILIGDVLNVESYWNDGHTQIRTRIRIKPTDYLKGAARRVENLDYVGGTVDDLTLIRTDTPFFEPGMHVLLFLDADDYLVGSFQGAYHTDGENAVRMVMPLDQINPATQQPLGLLVAQIAGALGMKQSPPITPYSGDYEIPSGGSRWTALGPSWASTCGPMGEDYLINPNCVDESAGDAASQLAALQAGADAWTNENLGFSFSYGGQTALEEDGFDQQNIVFFCPTGNCGMASSTIAVTGVWSDGCGNIVEWDMIFNESQYQFWDGQTGSCGGMQDIQAVGAHEFGHALGLGHSFFNQATMWSTIGTCSTQERSLHADDITGLEALYGDQTPANDDCADATFIQEGSTLINTACATTDGPQNHAACNLFGFGGVDFDVWYQYQPECTGTLIISTCADGSDGPTYDSKLAVYDGTDCGDLSDTILGCNDDDFAQCNCGTSRLEVPVIEGQWYLIRVGGYQDESGAATLNLECAAEINCMGDFDDDLDVDLDDLLEVIAGWGSPYILDDLLEVIANWSNICF